MAKKHSGDNPNMKETLASTYDRMIDTCFLQNQLEMQLFAPYALCMEHLPTFTKKVKLNDVGKYSIHGAHGCCWWRDPMQWDFHCLWQHRLSARPSNNSHYNSHCQLPCTVAGSLSKNFGMPGHSNQSYGSPDVHRNGNGGSFPL